MVVPYMLGSTLGTVFWLLGDEFFSFDFADKWRTGKRSRLCEKMMWSCEGRGGGNFVEWVDRKYAS